MKLNTEWNLGGAGDEIYAELIDAHADLTETESRRLSVSVRPAWASISSV